MSHIKSPNSGESVLRWAKDVTREINSLQPTASNGIRLTKNNAGTNYSIDNAGIPHADSLPHVIGGELSEDAVSALSLDVSALYATTYSLETGPQNSTSFWEFAKKDNQITTSIKNLSATDFVLRSNNTETNVLSSPTVVYADVLGLLRDSLSGPLSSEVQKITEGLSVVVDSEQVGQDLVSKSIYNNSKDALAIYHFENPGDDDLVSQYYGDELLILRSTVDNVPTVKYTSISALSAGSVEVDSEATNVSTKSVEHNSNDEIALFGFQSPTTLQTVTSTDLVPVRKVVSGVPTLQYVNAEVLSGEPETVEVDSEASTVSGKSIGHNSNNELELYNFHNASSDTFFKKFELAVRQMPAAASGVYPTLVYKALRELLTPNSPLAWESSAYPNNGEGTDKFGILHYGDSNYLLTKDTMPTVSTAEAETYKFLLEGENGNSGIREMTLGALQKVVALPYAGNDYIFDVLTYASLTNNVLTFRHVTIYFKDGCIYQTYPQSDINITLSNGGGSAVGWSGTTKEMTGITYNTSTHKLQYTYRNLTFQYGILTARSAEYTEDVTTAVPETVS